MTKLEPLTKKPKVGDKLIYLGISDSCITNGNVYEIMDIDSDGDPIYWNDYGEEEFIDRNEYGKFAEYIPTNDHDGYIGVETDFNAEGDELTTVTVTVDKQGYDTLIKLQDTYSKAMQRAEIQRQIDALQKQLKDIK